MATSSKETSTSAFEPISGEESEVTEIESMCVNCHENGLTKFLYITIPFYKEVVISSFLCEHCHFSNNEIYSAGTIQEKGVKLTLKITNKNDLNREVVRSDSASVIIPELDFEIPPSSQKGTLSTIEGIISRAVNGLEQEQPLRKTLQPEIAERIDQFIVKLKNLLSGCEEFSLVVDDPTGNSFIENPTAPSIDPNLSCKYYQRSSEQNEALGLLAQTQDDEPQTKSLELPEKAENIDLTEEVVSFPTKCSNCGSPVDTKMKMVKIPHFKEVIIMATSCDKCGDRSNEVKCAGGFEPKGKKYTLKVKDNLDLSRDVLKSETCNIAIPELDLETGWGSISGKFTTVEGLIRDIKSLMVDKNPFIGGDSNLNQKLMKVGEKLEAYADGEEPCTLILTDPASNSYVQDIYEPEPDPNLTFEEFERTFEQNEELGLNDMKTENY